MPGSNNFLTFNPGKTNQVDDTAYNASAYRSGGIPATPSAAPSNIHNKLFYQLSTMVSALAQMLANRGYSVSDSNFTDLVTTLDTLTDINLRKSLTAYVVGDIAFSRNATSYKRMQCTVAGTTGALEPTWTAVGQTVIDGTCTWKVTDIRDARNADTVGSKTADNTATNIALLDANGSLTKNTTGNAATATMASTALNIPTYDTGGNIWIE